MTEKQRHALLVGASVLGGIALFLLLERGRNATINLATGQPVTNNYTTNLGNSLPLSWPTPGFPTPSVMPTPAAINVNVAGPDIGYLATGYFPLFGFVGVDATQLYQ